MYKHRLIQRLNVFGRKLFKWVTLSCLLCLLIMHEKKKKKLTQTTQKWKRDHTANVHPLHLGNKPRQAEMLLEQNHEVTTNFKKFMSGYIGLKICKYSNTAVDNTQILPSTVKTKGGMSSKIASHRLAHITSNVEKL